MPSTTVARRATLGAAALGCLGLMVAAAGPAGAAGSAVSRNVVISDFRFTPRIVAVLPGDTVVWTNTDESPHGIESVSGPESFGTGHEVLRTGQAYRFTFTRIGTYHYVSPVDRNMSGTVTVGGNRQTFEPSDGTPNGGILAPLLPPRW